jgi:uncharacterized protein YbbC (DUF1343 family)
MISKIELIKAIFCLLFSLLFIYKTNLKADDQFLTIKKNISLGVDILLKSDLNRFDGKRIFILTNYAGRTSEGMLTVDALKNDRRINITGILTPEHGFYTAVPAGNSVTDDMYNNIPVYSLYGTNRSPSKDILQKCDIIIVDIQDIGIRSYTYLSTLYNVMKAAAIYGKQIIVLDRPNPLGGLIIDGGTVESELQSFVGIIPISYIHGCTIGELALMINEEGWLINNVDTNIYHKRESNEINNNNTKCNLEIIKMVGWQRWMAWEDTDLMWYPTSPHIPTPDAIRGAAMIGPTGELGIISVGIGTTLPFQYIGFPGMNTESILKILSPSNINGVLFIKSAYQPFYGKFNGQICNGILFKFTLSNLYQPYTIGIKILTALRRIHPELFIKNNISENQKRMYQKVTGSTRLLDAVINDENDNYISQIANAGFVDFISIRKKYLLY